jgi:L-fuculose-phosphate aldolase
MTEYSSKIKRNAEELAAFCKMAYRKGYIAGTEGNFSIRIPGDRFLITPGGMNKGLIESADMVICDKKGAKTEGAHESSSEARLHAMIYEYRSDVNAICHTHSVFATAFSLAGESLDKAILPEFVTLLGAAPLVPYATPGSEQLAMNLKKFVNGRDAFLLEKHGPLTVGRSLTEAFNRTEILERYAEILYYSRQINKTGLLPRSETRRLLEIGGRQDLLESIMTGEDN